MTTETSRMISDKTADQVARKLNDTRKSLKSQVQVAIGTAITEKVLPSVQNTLSRQARTNLDMMGQKSSEQHQGPEAKNSQKI